MNERDEIRAAVHTIVDRILDVAERTSDEDGLVQMVFVFSGMLLSNQDNSRYVEYGRAMSTLRSIGQSALNGQGLNYEEESH